MEDEEYIDNIDDFFDQFPDNFSVLEEEVDVNLQLEYFELSRKLRDEEQIRDLDELSKILTNEEIEFSELKEVLAEIAAIDSVEAYRFLESFVKESEGDIRQWALMAYQESKVLMQSSLLDENQFFISTGLGGKGKCLRYFAVVIAKEGFELGELQQKVTKNEFDFVFNENDCKIESLDFHSRYAAILALMPLKAPIKEIFSKAIDECNTYGEFLEEKFLITNVMKLSPDQVEAFLNAENKQEFIDKLNA
ncbi:MAG: hypothetical protein C0594_15860 [Marinilabiliales bacterium]|nr:MAG: hypothetical protein C0594_15860 [Marinilabiliales bacterium]